MYTLKNIVLADIGYIPGRQTDSNIALSGCFDMPQRLGKTSHSWADEPGIEPYVSLSDIQSGGFSGRNLNLTGFIKGTDREDCENKCKAVIGIFADLTDLIPLTSKWGQFMVLLNGVIQFKYLSNNYLTVDIPMREPEPIMPSELTFTGNNDTGIDGISFQQLGGAFLGLANRRNRPDSKASDITTYGKDGYQITQRYAQEMTLRMAIKQPTYELFKEKIDFLMSLFAAPGLRKIKIPNDLSREFFVKNGFTVNNLYSRPDFMFGIIECVIVQVEGIVKKYNQTITFPAIVNKFVDSEDFWPQVSVSSGLPITLTSSNESVAEVLSGNRIHITGIGQSIITATQPGNEQFNAATPKIQILRVTEANNQFTYTFPYPLS
ncbi:hypothetical protein N180_02730 [Pedobacter antarcticus 4BY]|uniref:Phage tail protein n=1 Tax=Pedobacter antarcticus 4BY TaxID=1358423 RepID=A0A081PKF7_9SPHI|nr:hypothetical protein N180_02730 [Pedobacter antarcticus 4BY]